MPWKQVLLFDTAVAAGVSHPGEAVVPRGEVGALPGWRGSGGCG